jgi:hypothetical protein
MVVFDVLEEELKTLSGSRSQLRDFICNAYHTIYNESVYI